MDPDWIRIRIGIQPKMLDLDPDLHQMNGFETLFFPQHPSLFPLQFINNGSCHILCDALGTFDHRLCKKKGFHIVREQTLFSLDIDLEDQVLNSKEMVMYL
jgi:hypothetical protein